MNMVDFQEKMDPTHRMYLCRMLNVKNLSDDLLERYAQVKRMVDRIDGHLTPCGLAMIIMSVRFNPEIATELAETTEGEDARLQAEADKTAVKSPALDASDDKVIEEAVEPPVSGATGQAVEKPAPEKGKAMLWSPRMPVKVLIEDELKKGKIFAVHPGEGNEPVQLTIEFEGGETVMVNEDEVEAV